MNSFDIIKFLTPNFTDLLQTFFFAAMLSMVFFTALFVEINATPKAWEKKWNRAANKKKGGLQGIEQGGVTDLFHIIATRSEKLSEIMPGMLLIVGLLGTFIGLGLALDKASSILSASNAIDAAGAADGLQNMLGMLKGLGTKFKTSTWGIAGFILLKLWSEIRQFEEKRLTWVIGKVKDETESRNAILVAAETDKWKKSVQLGNTMTSKLAAVLEKGFEKNSEFINIQTNELSKQINFISEQQDFISQKFTAAVSEILSKSTNTLYSQQASQEKNLENWLRQLIEGQSATQASFKVQTTATKDHTNSISDRLETQLKAINQQQAILAQQNMRTMTELLSSQTVALNEQNSRDMLENTRVIALLGDNMQRVADTIHQTNSAMQSFTNNTQAVVNNMGSAADRMASGADGVGKAATDLLGAVNTFEKQFTEVLNNVRTDLGNSISEMSSQASKTLETGSQKLSDSTLQISTSLEQLSGDVTKTMTEVRKSIEQALDIQRKASEESIASSKEFRGNVSEITSNIGKLAKPIEDGLQSISKSNVQMNSAVKKITDGLTLAEEFSQNFTQLTENISHFEGIPPAVNNLIASLVPITSIQNSVHEICDYVAKKSPNESNIVRQFYENLTNDLSHLQDIYLLIKEIRLDLEKRAASEIEMKNQSSHQVPILSSELNTAFSD
jgi:hypothetical protein